MSQPTNALDTAAQASREAAEAIAKRDAAIAAARAEEGSTLRKIAQECGLSHTAIAKIVDRETAKRS